MARQTFHDLIRANKRNSVILMIGMTLLLLGLGILILLQIGLLKNNFFHNFYKFLWITKQNFLKKLLTKA